MLAGPALRLLLSSVVFLAIVAAQWANAFVWNPLEEKDATGDHQYNEQIQGNIRKSTSLVAGSHVLSSSLSSSPHALVPQEDYGSADLSRHLQRRSLDQWQLADILVIGTIDGSLHARDRKTGVEMWTIPGQKPLVSVTSRGGVEDESDIIWIVEPLGDGALYYFKPSTGLKKLSVSIRQLIAGSPFSVEGDDRTYTGSTQTTLYTINASTGEIIKVYGAAKTGLGKPECKTKNVFFDYDDDDDDDDDEEDDYSTQENGIFKIGRTDYLLEIESKNGDPSWKVSYSTWGPNNVNIDLAAQHIMSLDDFYLVPLYDGNIVGMSPSSTKSRPGQWGGHISSAVINVFDLLRTNTGSESEPLVLLPQPPYVDLTLDIDEMDTFIERTDTGEWFALSAKYFPSLVKDAPEAPWTLGKGDLSTEISLQRSLIGVHRVEEPLGIGRLGRGGGAVIGSPLDGSHHIGVSSTSVPLAIAPPSQRYPQIHPVETRPSSAYSRDSMIYGPQPQLPPSKLSSWWSIIGRMIENVISVFLLIVLVVVGSRMGWLPQLVELLESILVRNNKYNNELEKLGGFRVNVDSVDTEENESQQLSASNIPSDSKTVMESSILQENTSSLKTDDRSYQPQNLVNGKESSRHVTIVEPEQTIAVSPTAPKKRKRGSRGGRKNRSDKDKNNVVDTNSSSQSLTKESEESNPSETQISSTNSSSPESGSTAHLGGLQSNGMAILSKEPIGYGSHGTLVYKGTFENREVAIKRVLLSFYDIASQEVALLQESDDHANVIRYYRMCREDEFLYIALELCPGSLHDIIEHPYDPKFETLLPRMNPIQVLYQIASGVNHLHLLKIVHRDIKPQNILVAPPKVIHTRSADGQVKESLGPIRMLISDFGLCKKLEGEQTSFRATTAQAAGTTGWTAPEIILARRSNYDNEHGSNCSSSLRESVNSDLTVDLGNRRLTRAVDIFSLGCVFYYTLTNGKHPFGSDTKRDGNVEENMFSLEELDDHDVPNNVEAQDLITKMISHDPRDRPEASSVLLHPLFWSFQKKLDFLLKFSDRFEADTREDYSELLTLFEKHAPEVVGKDWHLALDKPFVENLGKYRKYHGDRIIDLLRAMRNKCHHFNELPSGLQHLMGPVPDGYLLYFTKRFPLLLMTVYDFAKEHLSEENGFQVYFTPQE